MMSYCRYHPLDNALWSCPVCHYHYCAQCVDDNPSSDQRRSRSGGLDGDDARCFHCAGELNALPISGAAEPFWQRLDRFFRYPLQTESLILLTVIAVLSTLASILPTLFAVLAVIGLNGVLFKYGFAALRQTIDGEFDPPSITAAYGGGGTKLFLQLFLLCLFAFIAVALGFHFLGQLIGSMMAIAVLISLPAMIILFACSENIFSALNPFANLSLMTTIGLPYGLLLCFLFMMMTSSSVLVSLTAEFGLVSTLLQMLISNYYTLVMLHMLGYIVYQYSNELGIVTSANKYDSALRNERDYYQAKLSILLKEGRYEEMLSLYDTLLKKPGGQDTWLESLMQFLLVSQDAKRSAYYADAYIGLLLRQDKLDHIRIFYQRVTAFNPQFKPQKSENLQLLAQQLYDKGAYKHVLKLLHGCHKQHADAPELVAMLSLMAESFAHLGRDDDEQEYRRYIASLA